ncbi:MAG: Unknown protein [uncultured Sulfurovum sp.]|uniref:DUF2868 domain-containing protein n=1 Tax=uncultured Sulfurovum sp. TaxID=269237 RepID=A0A6S6S6H6_9BACT|nr:MAG: Unknown protein [uncultured Sulfurovum sp.]
MQKKNSQFTLKSYLDLAQLLKHYKGNHEENRVFALAQKSKGLKLVSLWMNKNLYRVVDELDSSKYLHYLTLLTSLFGFTVLLVGFFTGFTLLSYSGKEPVNVIYLLLVMVGLPLLSMGLTVLSMFSGNLGASFFNHFSPLYYLEKVINFLPFARKIDFSELPFSATLSKWIFLQRLQFFSFLFALGLFFSLVLTIVSKDIAFAWSSTLEIDPVAFQGVLATLATPWQSFFPSAVPSLELVEVSHYFRLGEKLDANMVQNADKLGAWWKFLAMATLTYAILLRLLLWFGIELGFKVQLKKEILVLEGVKKLLREFKTPFVSTQSKKLEQHLEIKEKPTLPASQTLADKYASLVAWNYTDKELLLLQDHNKIKVKSMDVLGGRNSFSQDKLIVDKLKGKVLFYVKAWEPPTMDFIDCLADVLEKDEVTKVEVCPLGTSTENYSSKESDIEVWLKKLEKLDCDKLEVIDV